MKVILSTLNAKFIHSSLALRYLKHYCQPVCQDIQIKEYTINNHLLDILSDIYALKPDVIGFACYIWNIEMTIELVRLLRKVLPEVTVILGGPEVSFDAPKLLEDKSIDYIIVGEGEEALKKLLKQLRMGPNHCVGAIEGLVYRSGHSIINSSPATIEELDSIPFPYIKEDVADLSEKIIYYESTRGCPFSCQYCLSSATKGVRFLSLERVFQDMEFFIKSNVRQVKFVDRTFNAKKQHYFPLLKFLANKECRTNFHFEIAVDLLDEEVLEFLKTVPLGRFQFEIGVQSTNETTLAAICRKNDWEKITRNIKSLKAGNNIHLHLDLIIGLPHEGYTRFGQSFNDVYALQPHMLQLGFLKMLKGSGVRNTVLEHQYVYMDKAPYEILSNRYLTYAEVRKLKIFEDIFEQMYNSGRFRHTLPFLIKQFNGNAFKFYHDLTEYWEQRGLHMAAHSTKALYEYLLAFCEQINSSLMTVCKQYLKFDALISDQGAVRPEFLDWNEQKWNYEKTEFWRNTALVQKYLPEYTFQTWREIKKKFHIEVFYTNVAEEYAENQSAVIPMLFSYGKQGVKYQYIDLKDFEVRG